jgi:hypothetical protein
LSSSIFIDVENKDKSTRKFKEDKLKKKRMKKKMREDGRQLSVKGRA